MSGEDCGNPDGLAGKRMESGQKADKAGGKADKVGGKADRAAKSWERVLSICTYLEDHTQRCLYTQKCLEGARERS